MIVAETIESKGLLSAKVRAYCASTCTITVGLHGFDLVGADSWTVTHHSFLAGDKVRLKVRRPFPRHGEVVDTTTILQVESIRS